MQSKIFKNVEVKVGPGQYEIKHDPLEKGVK